MTDAPAPSHARRAITSLVLVILLLGLGRAGFSALAAKKKKSVKAPGQVLPEVVRVRTAERVDYTEVLSGFGKARALRRTSVSAEVAGYVEWISDRIEPGTAICFECPAATNGEAPLPASGEATEAGPLVVRLEQRDFADQLERAQADVRVVDADRARLVTARKSLEERLALSREEEAAARREWARIERLVKDKRLARGELDAERLRLALRERAVIVLESDLRENADQVKLLEARHIAREQDVRIAARHLGRASVHVPFPGIVAERSVNAGDHVRVGDPLFTMLDLSTVEIPIALPARRYTDIEPGTEAIVFDAQTGDVLWRGTVSRIAPEINERERTFHVFLEVPGEPTRNPVPPGRHVRAEIVGRTFRHVAVVPREVFVGDDIYVVTPDPDAPQDAADRYVIAERRTPAVVRRLTAVALVETGLEEGESYVVSNLESVAHGTRLRVAPEVSAGDDR